MMNHHSFGYACRSRGIHDITQVLAASFAFGLEWGNGSGSECGVNRDNQNRRQVGGNGGRKRGSRKTELRGCRAVDGPDAFGWMVDIDWDIRCS